jgi:hypothetical protein
MATKNTPATQATTGEIAPMRPAEQYRNFMLRTAQDAATGPNKGERASDIMDAQVDRIINTAGDDDASDDDIWNADAGGTVQARDVPGLEVRIHDISSVISNRDDIENNKGYYATMTATILGGPEDVLVRQGLTLGSDIALQTGAELISAKVQAFKSRGRLPIDGVITAIPTASGNEILKLRPMPKRVQS